MATENEWTFAERFIWTRALPHDENYGTWADCLYVGVRVMFSIEDYHLDSLMETKPLYFAASFGMAPIVRRLLSRSGSIDLKYSGGRCESTALQMTCYRGRLKVAEILMAAGTDFWNVDSGSDESAW